MGDVWINLFLYLAYILVVVAALASIAGPVVQIIKDPKKYMVTVVAIGGVAVLFLLFYAITPGHIPADIVKMNIEVGHAKSKLIDSALYLMYALGGSAVLLMIASEAMNFIRR